MWKRTCLLSIGLILSTVLSLFGADEKRDTPTLIVRVASFEKLMDDAKYLAGLADVEEYAKQFEGLIKSMVGESGLDGFDIKKPIGLYGDLGGNVIDSTAVLMLPVADEKAVLALLERFEIKPEKADDGVYTVKKVDKLPEDVYFRFANKYAYITARDRSAVDKKKLLAPEAVFLKDDTSIVSVQFNLEQIPEGLKNIGLTQLELGIADEKEKKRDGETKVQHELKIQVLDELFTRVSSVVKDGSQATLTLNVDRKAGEIVLDARMTAKKNSGLAKDIADLENAKGIGAALPGKDSALNGAVRINLPEKVGKAFAAAVREEAKQNLNKEDDKAKKALGEKLLAAVLPTIERGSVDAGIDLRGPNKKQLYTLIACGGVEKGKDLDATLREAVKVFANEIGGLAKLDAETVSGTGIHAFDVLQFADENVKGLLGDGPLYVAIREDAVFVAAGPDALSAVKDALKLSPKPAKALQMELSISRIGPLLEKEKPGIAKILEAVFAKNKDADKVRISLEGGNAVHARISVKGEILRVLAKLATGE